MTRFRTKYRFLYIAVWSAAAIALSIIEGLIPMPPLIYGAKPGLANIVSMAAIELLGVRSALFVVIIRCTAAAMLTGTVVALPYSLAGGIAACLVMAAAYKMANGYISFVGISVLGAAAHSLGQIIVAAFLVGSRGIFMYLPLLMLISSALGIFTGLCANFLVFEIKKHSFGRLS